MPLIFSDKTYCCNRLYEALCMGHIEANHEKPYDFKIRSKNSRQEFMRISNCPFCGQNTMVKTCDNTNILGKHGWAIL